MEQRAYELAEQFGVLTTADLEAAGISRVHLPALLEKGVLQRVAHGMYAGPDAEWDDMALLMRRCAKGVFSHGTALYLHDLTDRAPIAYHVTVPRGYNAKSFKDDHVVFHYVSKEWMALGVSESRTPEGSMARCFDRERTICDIVRDKKNMDISLFTDALKRYVTFKERDLMRLHEYARRMKVEEKLNPYLEVLL